MGIDFLYEFFKLLNNYNVKSIDKFFSLINKIGSSIFYNKLDKNKVQKILQNI